MFLDVKTPREVYTVARERPVVRVDRLADRYRVYFVDEGDAWGILSSRALGKEDILVWVSEEYAYFPAISLRHDPVLYGELLEATLSALGDDVRRPGFTPAPRDPEVMALWRRYVGGLKTLILRFAEVAL